MPTIYASKGLPGSGKSTFARQFISESPSTIIRANRDDIRFMLYGVYFGPPIDEDIVSLVQYTIIAEALKSGYDVYIDDTNLSPFVQRNIYNAADRMPNTDVVWHDHTQVPIAVCVDRDSARERQVGEDVIVSMWRKYIDPDRKSK